MSSSSQGEELRRRGKKCLRSGNFAMAADVFRKLIEAEPGNVAAHEGLATAYFSMNEYESAVETFMQVSRLDPRQGRALVNLGAVYNRMGDYSKAIDVLRRGVQKDRSCPQGYYNMGLAHRGLNQLSMAVSAYREAIRIDANMAEAHQNLANVYLEMRNLQQAVVHYEKALEIKPTFDRARRGLENARSAVRRQQQSVSPFGRLVDTEAALEQNLTAGSFRPMSVEERRQDRERITDLSGQISDSANGFLAQLRDEVAPRVLALSRAVSQADSAPYAVIDAYEKFGEAIRKNSSLRRLLKKQMDELQKHVDGMRTV